VIFEVIWGWWVGWKDGGENEKCENFEEAKRLIEEFSGTERGDQKLN